MLDDCVAMFENTKMHKRRRSDIMVIGHSIMNHQSWICMNPNQIKCLISIRRVEKWKKMSRRRLAYLWLEVCKEEDMIELAEDKVLNCAEIFRQNLSRCLSIKIKENSRVFLNLLFFAYNIQFKWKLLPSTCSILGIADRKINRNYVCLSYASQPHNTLSILNMALCRFHLPLTINHSLECGMANMAHVKSYAMLRNFVIVTSRRTSMFLVFVGFQYCRYSQMENKWRNA